LTKRESRVLGKNQVVLFFFVVLLLILPICISRFCVGFLNEKFLIFIKIS